MSEEVIELPSGASAEDVVRAVSRNHPALAELLERLGGSLLVSVNGRRVAREHPLEEGCEVALLPPFSGG